MLQEAELVQSRRVAPGVSDARIHPAGVSAGTCRV
jgi:hypothetical protein